MSGGLLAREDELAAVARAIDAARNGTGAVLVLEGPAGIGKTAVLDAARREAAGKAALTLAARASELDRGFGFGLVHQLLDRAAAERELTGAAAHAAAVFDPASDAAEGFAVLHGLYWLVANLSDDAPVVLLVDDLHWADEPSARFLEYLGRRLDGLPVAVIATMRPNEPGAPAELLDELRAGPSAEVVRPGPLGRDEAADLLERALGVAPDAAVIDAALTATGGNPLLLSVLAREAANAGLGTAPHAGAGLLGGAAGAGGAAGQASGASGAGEGAGLPGGAAGAAGSPSGASSPNGAVRGDEAARAIAELGARGVAPAVERRLRPLGADAVKAARAVAVLGERATTDDVAAVAGITPEEAARALDRLAAAEVLQPRSRVYVHPLVRAAVLDACPAGERAALHRAAALRLRERGVRPGAVAPHWQAAGPAGDPRAVEDLTAAARDAAGEGATDLAAEHVTRALAEPPQTAQERVALALELGELEVRAQRPDGPPRLRALLREGLDGDAAARAHAALANDLVHTDPAAAIHELEQAVEDAAEPALLLRLEASLLEALLLSSDPRYPARIEQGVAEGSLAAIAHAASDGALRGIPSEELLPLATAALADGALLHTVGPASSTWNLVTHAFRFAEDARGAERALRAGDRMIREHGLLAATLFVEQAWGYWHRDFGSVALGAARSRGGLEAIRAQGMPVTVPALTAVLAENLVELDRLEEAAAEVDVDLGAAEGTFIEPFVLTIRGRVRFLLRRYDEAEADLRRVVAYGDAAGWRAPNAALARLRLAEVLAATGRGLQALELMDHDLAAARHAQRRGCEGMALRRRALVLEPGEAIDTLRTAVEILATTDLRLEHGWALHDLGTRLRLRGDRVNAREPLRQALEIAARTESALLARQSRSELEASGARLRRERLEGVEALTPAERRVAQLAAEGLTNRQIAETLWVTLKTVEVHLGRTYNKLAIASRRDLAGALGVPAAA